MTYTNITPVQLSDVIESKPAPFLLDVREPFELTAFGSIPGVVNIPMEDLPERLDDLPGDKSSTIVVICQSGSRSAEISRYLIQKGFTSVFNLAGGTYAWLSMKGGGIQ
jgi:rhodanese-related sulfurtransferase